MIDSTLLAYSKKILAQGILEIYLEGFADASSVTFFPHDERVAQNGRSKDAYVKCVFDERAFSILVVYRNCAKRNGRRRWRLAL
eukprot:8641733-Karenia_brevis.AAC.1